MMFITFEGIDLAGKTTQVQLLAKFLKDKGHKVVILREPGGTEISEKIRTLLLDSSNQLTSFTELFLFEAARSDLVQKIIKPSLEKGTIVICDRFWDSTIAYQGYGRNIPLEFIEMCNKYASGGLEPDLTFFVDISLETMIQRVKNKRIDRIENEPDDFIEKVINGFREIAKRYSSRIYVLKGTDSVETIHQNIIKVVLKFLEIENGKKS